MQITVIDYGIGNLLSVTRALEHCGARVDIGHTAAHIAAAQRLVLPGVGAFAGGMRGLRDQGLAEAIQEFAQTGRPLLGICLGMQMLAAVGEEFGENPGLNLIAGRVRPLPDSSTRGQALKIPYIGWKNLQLSEHGLRNPPLAPLKTGDAVYLVHSFEVVPENPAHVLAQYDYGGHAITAAIGRENILGLQFHPEKSGEAGLKILRGFLAV